MRDTELGATQEVAPFVRAAMTGQEAETAGPIETLYSAFEKLGRAHNDACVATMAAEERYVAPELPRSKGGALLKVDAAVQEQHLAIVEAYRDECRRRADAAGLTAAREAEEAARIPAQAVATALLEMEPTTLREAAFQAAIIEGDCYDDQDVDPFRLAKRMVRLAGITKYWLWKE